MKVGDYARTKDGYIGKISKIQSNERTHLYQKTIYTDNFELFDIALEEDIIKSSPNIIDLIEIGDYVNGFSVLHIENNELICGLLLKYTEEDIKSIVTKEQFESMEYKVGD